MVIPCTWANTTAWNAPPSNGNGKWREIVSAKHDEDARREKALRADLTGDAL